VHLQVARESETFRFRGPAYRILEKQNHRTINVQIQKKNLTHLQPVLLFKDSREAGNLRIGSSIIYEDHWFLVVDKPANLLVHPTCPGGPNTLWDELRKFLAYEIVNGGQISFVNRLDRETSGLILVAKSTESARALSRLISQHRIRKIYIAIVFGWPESDAFVVNQPLLRQGTVRPSKIWLKQTVHPDGYPALTEFRVARRVSRGGKPFALLAAEPRTGRTHQIRVHLAHAGHPIVGDKIYGPDENCYLDFIASDWSLELEARLLLPRQALHASALSFKFDGADYSFTAPMPRDLEDWLALTKTGRSVACARNLE
jgi:23S rRNA pseudouridine1911/1915/1917 synthase